MANVPTGARNPALEAAIRRNRDDGSLYDVYADWLQEHDNPIGELIAVQRQLTDSDLPALRAREAGLLAMLRPTYDPGADHPVRDQDFSARWRWGLWDSLRIDPLSGGTNLDCEIDAEGAERFAFAHTACAALRELRVALHDWRWHCAASPPLLKRAAEHAWAGDLRSLVLGDDARLPGDYPETTATIGETSAAISATFPRLSQLAMYARGFGLAELALPELETLVIATRELAQAQLAELCASTLPALTSLELWIGAQREGAEITAAELAPLVAGDVFPNLTELGICNARIAHEVACTIHRSRLAPQLTRLDLSKGTLASAGAIELARHSSRFVRLQTLDVSSSFLGADAIALLERAFTGVRVIAGDQRGDDLLLGDYLWLLGD